MSHATHVEVSFGALPAGFCPSTPQDLVNKLNDIVAAELDTELVGVIVQQTKPAADDQDKLWVELDAGGSVISPWFYSANYSLWVWPHWAYSWASGPARILYAGALGAGGLDDFDGGETAGVSDTTGPFWTQDTDWTDRIPIGAGATAALNTNVQRLGVAAPTEYVRGVYLIKRTARLYHRHA